MELRCHSRRDLPGEAEYFYCAHPRVHAPGQRVYEGVCRACGRWRDPPPEEFRPFPPPPPRGRCLFLGAETGLRDCPTCSGSVRVKVFACAHPAHGETTLAECPACPDHREAGEGPGT
jgi:hypothetical protein